MLEITLQRAGRRLLKEAVGESAITVGRSRENTIRLLDPDISREHCRIEWRDGALHAVDLSSNGMLVNGERVKEARVDAGDRITVGQWNLLVDSTVDAVPVKTIAARPEATRVISYDPAEKRFRTQRVEIIVQSPEQAPLKKRLAKGEILIGHHGACDVAVADPFVSRRHCKMILEEGQARLIDLASTNGVWLRGARVAQASLEPQGTFRIGRSTVSYRVVSGAEELKAADSQSLGALVGTSRPMREIFALIRRVAPSSASVVITGESGTGKELAARELHRLSARSRGPFVAVNCGALPSNIVESQLFGHERGAFTGAVERMPGLIEQSGGGTLFLDEIGEMPLELQTRFLRVLEDKKVRRVGGQAEIEANFRLIAATNRDLKQMARDGRFREDLLYRIMVVPMRMPPLRERPEDIALLARKFAAAFSPEGVEISFTDAAIDALAACPWPGNARELKNAVERSVLFAGSGPIDRGGLDICSGAAPEDPGAGLKEQEREHIAEALAECKGNICRSARMLGIARSTIKSKIKKYNIRVPR